MMVISNNSCEQGNYQTRPPDITNATVNSIVINRNSFPTEHIMTLQSQHDALLLYLRGRLVAGLLQARQRLLGEREVLEGPGRLTAVTLVLSLQAGGGVINLGIF